MVLLEAIISNVLGAFALFLLCSAIYNWIKSRGYPPGPIGLPVIGYMPFLGKKPNITLRDLSKKYGDIFSFYIGPQLVICVNDYRLAKEILNHPLTLARPPHSFDFLVGKGGFSGMNGEEWQEQRRFALLTMRDLGLGRGLWETMIQEDAAEFVKKMKKANGQPISYTEPLALSQIMNSLSLLFGRHLDPEADKEDIETLQKLGRKLMDKFSAVDLTMNLPWLTKLLELLNLSGIQDFMILLKNFEDIFKKEVERRLRSKEERTKDDFIGCYLREMEKRENSSQPHNFTVINLRGNLFILFVAGQDSTVASVGWLLLLMAKFPDVQQRICDEIDKAIGRDGTVYYGDRNKLPYTTATMLEMMRWVAINPLFPPRYVLDTFTFNGYTIPKGAHIICNSWAMLHDPRYFEDPMEFKPERFLSEEGKCVKRDGYGPFSFGKRNCPGEGIAMMSMYLYFVSIMQKFKIKTPYDLPPDMEYKYSAGVLPKPQKLCFIER
ncbi:cytochrome P450 2C15-like isoform X1 [Argiope bruennichi]|uniref:Cytochrome P450 2J6 like protein n=1 Tax=Argiope bruennichi TaxID=94029 RepID=A0A8T0FEI0_ARGBR|nr:cytochrome P450 2C15-like isoform X1 [Argiope bruennichi]KAF8787690.1 Cytochrome P450 2J6 like protein [Argiope bruennichi]